MFLMRTKYTSTPTYVCDKCKKKLTEYRPRRLGLNKYERDKYKVYKNIDLCTNCYNEFVKWYKGE